MHTFRDEKKFSISIQQNKNTMKPTQSQNMQFNKLNLREPDT